MSSQEKIEHLEKTVERYRADSQEMAPYKPIIDYLRDTPELISVIRNFIQGRDADPPKMTHNIHSGIHVDMDKIKYVRMESLVGKTGNPYA